MNQISMYIQRGLVSDIQRTFGNIGCSTVTEFCRMAAITYYNHMCEGHIVSPYSNLTSKYKSQPKDYAVTVSLDTDIYHKIKLFCSQHGHTASAFLREAVAYYIAEVGFYESTDSYSEYEFADYMGVLYNIDNLGIMNSKMLNDIRKSVRDSKFLSKTERDILNRYVKYLTNDKFMKKENER